jgi:serine protease Do
MRGREAWSPPESLRRISQGLAMLTSNLARQVMDQIVSHGSVQRAYLGVTIQEVTPAISKAIGLDGPKGALVGDVSPNSPAQKAGLQSGDVILSMNGTPILESNQLRMNISMMETGQNVKLKVFRNGQTQELTAVTAALPGTKVAKNDAGHSGENSGMDGVSVESLDARTAQQSGLSPNMRGLVVTGVDPASAAASAGLKEGDVIQEVNHNKVANTEDLSSALGKSNGESLLLINRNGNKLYLAVSCLSGCFSKPQ